MLQSLSLFTFLRVFVALADSELHCEQPAIGANLLQVSVPPKIGKPDLALPDEQGIAQHERLPSSPGTGAGIAQHGGPLVPREHREAALRDCAKMFTEAGLKFSAAFGTALTLFRDGRLAEEDDDVDFMVHNDSFVNLLVPALEQFNSKLSAKLVYEINNPHVIRVYAENWGPVDLYNVRPIRLGAIVKDPSESDLLCQNNDMVMMNSTELFPAKLVDIESAPGVPVPIPHLAEQHARRFYGGINGTDWKTPKTHEKGRTYSREAVAELWGRLC